MIFILLTHTDQAVRLSVCMNRDLCFRQHSLSGVQATCETLSDKEAASYYGLIIRIGMLWCVQLPNKYIADMKC